MKNNKKTTRCVAPYIPAILGYVDTKTGTWREGFDSKSIAKLLRLSWQQVAAVYAHYKMGKY